MAQSVEPQIADLANGWLKHYELNYFIEQEAPNSEIKNKSQYAVNGAVHYTVQNTQYLCTFTTLT